MTERLYDIGVVVGKFYPYHRGHQYLLQTAHKNCKKLYIYVCDQAWQQIPADIRRDWIQLEFPDAVVEVLDQEGRGLDDNDSLAWAKTTLELVGEVPDVVFTSEEYGHTWAQELSKLSDKTCHHFLVDQERSALPVSGTLVREEPLKHLDWLPPQVREYFTVKVAIIGAESTGKTTLCEDIAAVLNIKYVPEFGRYYAQALPDPENYLWKTEDMRLIARRQRETERYWSQYGDIVTLCDTNVFVTKAFCELFTSASDPEIEALVAEEKYDLVIMPDPATPFVDDGAGRRQDLRSQMNMRYQEYVKDKNHLIVYGSRSDRAQVASAAIKELVRTKWLHLKSGHKIGL